MPDTITAAHQERLRSGGTQRDRKSTPYPRIASCFEFFNKEYLSGGAQDDRSERPPRGQGVLRGAGALLHQSRCDPGRGARDRPQGSCAHSGRNGRGDQGDWLQGQFRGIPEIPAHRSAFLRAHAGRVAQRRLLHRKADRRHAAGILRQVAAPAVQRAAGTRRARAQLHGGRYTPPPIGGTKGGEFWVNTYALDKRPLYALHRAHPARGSAGPSPARFPRARARERAGVSPRFLSACLWRGLGPLLGKARQGNGPLQDALRRVRTVDVRDVARVSARRRHRHARQGLVARASARISREQHGTATA